MMRQSLALAVAFIAVACDAAAEEAQCAPERAAMIETIRAHARRDIAVLGPQGISEGVLKAVADTERQRFVPWADCAIAHADRPLPIGHDSTISQPFIVALMTHLAEVAPDQTALEIGTGSGYQAAILARLVRQVCTVEIVAPLAVAAAKVLNELGHDNARAKIGDGYQGWPDCGPFDAIIVTAALGHVPPLLIEQLKVGGRLVMPMGHAGATQLLVVVEKFAPDQVRTRSVALVRFVPFIRPPN